MVSNSVLVQFYRLHPPFGHCSRPANGTRTTVCDIYGASWPRETSERGADPSGTLHGATFFAIIRCCVLILKRAEKMRKGGHSSSRVPYGLLPSVLFLAALVALTFSVHGDRRRTSLFDHVDRTALRRPARTSGECFKTGVATNFKNRRYRVIEVHAFLLVSRGCAFSSFAKDDVVHPNCGRARHLASIRY